KKNEDLDKLSDEVLKLTSQLRIAEAEIERLKKELESAKKGTDITKVPTYIVEEGDSLWKIAKKLYNDPYKWLWLFKANIDQIEDPDYVYPQQVLEIPRY
ncbi:MAG: LysM peptidoglycan-binding domain-containing protein, partial [Candidatus Omnitrophica bacterium]|nr:LysM peptidoglycan-binding domain-containing protein [Candidatus Omnitrophota bacterium]